MKNGICVREKDRDECACRGLRKGEESGGGQQEEKLKAIDDESRKMWNKS
jgi:hypothetical protein